MLDIRLHNDISNAVLFNYVTYRITWMIYERLLVREDNFYSVRYF